jgi:hypothetical protein
MVEGATFEQMVRKDLSDQTLEEDNIVKSTGNNP